MMGGLAGVATATRGNHRHYHYHSDERSANAAGAGVGAGGAEALGDHSRTGADLLQGCLVGCSTTVVMHYRTSSWWCTAKSSPFLRKLRAWLWMIETWGIYAITTGESC